MARIAFVSQDGLSTLNFCRWFAREFKTRPNTKFYTISSIDLYRNEIEGLGSRHFDVSTDRYLSPLQDLRYFLRLVALFRQQRFDIVLTFGTKPNLYGAIAAKVAGVPRVIVAVRGLGRMFSSQRTVSATLMALATRRLYALAFWSASKIWFTNQVDRDAMVRIGIVSQERSFVTTNSVDPDHFSLQAIDDEEIEQCRAELRLTPDQQLVVMVGRLIWAKGIREFIHAAQIVRAERPNARFVLVATLEDNSPQAVPKEFVEQAAARGDITWLPYVKDLRPLYALADVAVLPSYYQEGGYPRALLEPMALGKPVIAADTPECRGPIEPGRNGFLVAPRDGRSLAAHVETLLAEPELRQRFGEFSRQLILERFSDGFVGMRVLAEMGASV